MNDVLSNTATWALILGLLTPLVTSVVQQPHWSSRVRVLVALLAAVVVGSVTVLSNGTLNTADWFTTVGLVLVAAQTAYQTIYKPAGIAKVIELSTSPAARRRARRHDYAA